MVCPICKKNLEKAIFYEVEVNYCPKCLGLWFEEEELRWAKDEKDGGLKWLDIDLWRDGKKFKIYRGIRLCPSCRLPLYEVYYPDSSNRGSSIFNRDGDSRVIVDICNLCKGVWLDRGEFENIIKYLKQKADYEILNNYLKNLIEEFWEIFVGPETFREEVSDFLTILKLLNYKFAIQHPNLAKLISSLPK